MRNLNFILASILAFFSTQLYAQNFAKLGARSIALGGSSICIIDPFAAQNNQANLAFLTAPYFQASYVNSYLLPNLGVQSFSVGTQLMGGVGALSYNGQRFNEYIESNFGLAYAQAFGNFAIGAQLDYLNLQFGNFYGSKNAITFQIGVSAKINQNVRIAAHIYNPTGVQINDYQNEQLPSTIRIGALYSFSNNAFISGEIEKSLNYRPTLKMGFEYPFNNKLSVRAGASTLNNLLSLGLGTQLKNIRFDGAIALHQVLGISPAVSISVPLKKSEWAKF